MSDDTWAALVGPFADEAYATVKGYVRTYVLHHQLLEHLPPPPTAVLDVGGGAGHQCFPLAQVGYDVTLLDSSPAMLDKARERLQRLPPDAQGRVGALELKGLDRPVEAEEVVWLPVATDIVGPTIPPTLADRGAFPFAGRVKEAEALAGAWSAVSSGATRLVLVAGEPGIGKTRLAAQAASQAAATGGVVLAGRCDELVGTPYQPFADALRFHVGQRGGTDRLGPAPGELVRLVAELAELVPDLPAPLTAAPDAERLRLFDAVRGWLGEVSATQPIIIVVDDLHWADTGSLLLLRHVVVTDPVPRLLVVGTYRDTDLVRTHPLSGMLGEFRRRTEVTRVALEGLDVGEVTDLMSLAAGHDLEEDARALALAVQGETGGNPFFVGEVLRHLAESGAIVYADGRWRAGPHGEDRLLPEGIREVVGKRLAVLPEATQTTLRTAAVIGVDFDLELLAAVTGDDEDRLIDALEPALVAHLVTETGVGRYRFSHALVRSTLHGELSTTRRARIHRSVAQALEILHSESPDEVTNDLAYHWGEAGPATAQDRAITYARRAAELAFERLAPEEAARWYGHAREQLDGSDPGLDAELAYRLGQAQSLAGADGWQDTLLEAARLARAVGNIALMAEALCISRRSVLTEASPESANLDKVSLLEQALGLASDDHALAARLSGALALELIFTGDLRRRAALVEASEQYARQIEDPVERHRILQLSGQAVPFSKLAQRVGESADNWRAVIPVAHARGDQETEASALTGVFYAALWLGLPDRHDLIGRLGEILDGYPHPFFSDELLLEQMVTALIDGRIAEAEELTNAIQRQWRSHGRGAEANIYVSSGQLQVARERVGLGSITEMLQAIPMQPSDKNKPTALSGLVALSLAQAGNHDDVKALLDERSVNGFCDVPDDSGRPVALSTWAEAAALTGHVGACQALYAQLLPTEGIHQATGGWYLGSTARYLGLLADVLGRPDEADERFRRAAADHERMRTPPWAARGRLDWAESFLQRGETAEARALVMQALEDVGELELDASRARAERLLESL